MAGLQGAPLVQYGLLHDCAQKKERKDADRERLRGNLVSCVWMSASDVETQKQTLCDEPTEVWDLARPSLHSRWCVKRSFVTARILLEMQTIKTDQMTRARCLDGMSASI